MKRIALLFLTTIYLLSVVGIGINRFYCCGELISVTLTYAAKDHTDKNNCCRHESKSFKIKDSHVNADFFALTEISPALLPIAPIWDASSSATPNVNIITHRANDPPDNPVVPIYTKNCAYRI